MRPSPLPAPRPPALPPPAAAATDVVKAGKRQANKGASPFPLTAAQRFSGGVFENGVFVGNLGYLTFEGPYASGPGRQLSFDVDVVQMNVGLGPLRFSLPLKSGAAAAPLDQRPAAERRKLPFFLYAYVDEDLVVARGRSGGLAAWLRADAAWEANSGTLQRFP